MADIKEFNGEYFIKSLNLEQHIENGFFKEIYRSKNSIENKSILSTIYFLIKKGSITRFRKLSISDEVICYNKGKSFEVLLIDPQGKINIEKLGLNIEKGENFQIVIPADYIACFKCKSDDDIKTPCDEDFSLFACICGPAFNYEDFQIISNDELIRLFPNIDIDFINAYQKDL